MAYEGDVLMACGLVQPDFTETYIVAVSGDGPNVCGHLLVYDARGGYYFHAVGDPGGRGLGKMVGYPLYMTDAGYRRYLSECGKTELRRRRVSLPNPAGARDFIENRLADTWAWGVLPHNCVAFVEAVISAGGGSWGSYSNCPAIAVSDSLEERVNRFYNWMESGVYELYGVPRF
ncbi:MAG TPA: hypothetical protein VG692_18915 [Gemmatimonadales bacterium]|nr:hypothetical protein [Gemmatimonadales bacterium]